MSERTTRELQEIHGCLKIHLAGIRWHEETLCGLTLRYLLLQNGRFDRKTRLRLTGTPSAATCKACLRKVRRRGGDYRCQVNL